MSDYLPPRDPDTPPCPNCGNEFLWVDFCDMSGDEPHPSFWNYYCQLCGWEDTESEETRTARLQKSARPDTQHEILVIGDFDLDGNPVGWVFGGKYSHASGLDLGWPGKPGNEIKWGGYTVEQLRAIKEAYGNLRL